MGAFSMRRAETQVIENKEVKRGTGAGVEKTKKRY
jgi:hypothetical protein